MRTLAANGLLISVIFIVGAMQYANVIFDMLSTGQVPLWVLATEELESAGFNRYIKDGFVLLISAMWLIQLSKLSAQPWIAHIVAGYILWVPVVVVIGCISFLFDRSPLFFLPAGLRWVLLLHASFGIFIVISGSYLDSRAQRNILYSLVLLSIINTWAILEQLAISTSVVGLAFGNARLTGVFGNAGVASFFALGVCLISVQLKAVPLRYRFALTLVAAFMSLSSGTRLVTMSIMVMFAYQIWSSLSILGEASRRVLKLFILPTLALLLVFAYNAIISVVDRGSAVSQQFESGGRVSNFINAMDVIISAEPLDILFGRGLGVGTNTAVGSLINMGDDPSDYVFNILVDNGILTCFFQFGLIGSIVFWFGIFGALKILKSRLTGMARTEFGIMKTIFILILFAGNPFEHYFLMMSFAAAVGILVSTERANRLVL